MTPQLLTLHENEICNKIVYGKEKKKRPKHQQQQDNPKKQTNKQRYSYILKNILNIEYHFQ